MSNQQSYTAEQDSAWERSKAALRNDWEQTRSDFGSDTAKDLGQDVDDTIKQAFGTDGAFENHEQALRFGATARSTFGSKHPQWNDELDATLRTDYSGDYDRDRSVIRYGYGYQSKV